MPAPADPPGGAPRSSPFDFAQVSSGGAAGGGPTAPLDAATGTWHYSGHTVSFAKLGSWYLLLYVAFVTVTLVSRSTLHAQAAIRGHTSPRQ